MTVLFYVFIVWTVSDVQMSFLNYEVVSLPYGVEISYLDGENRVMFDPSGGFVIFPKITSFKIVGDKVVGMRERPVLIIDDEDPAFTTVFGPFYVLLKRDGTFEGYGDDVPQ